MFEVIGNTQCNHVTGQKVREMQHIRLETRKYERHPGNYEFITIW